MATSDIEIAAVVIDSGSGYIKAGLAGEDAPKTCFRSIVGKHKSTGICIAMDQKDHLVGEEAYEKRGNLEISYPIKNGLIQDWEGIEKIWHHSYYEELKVPPEEHPCLLTETPLNTSKNREKMAEMMFEVFNVPSLYIASQAVLALYSSGKTTGLVLDSGYGVTHSVPIYEGYSLYHSIMKIDVGGSDLTQYLMELLQKSGISFSSIHDIDTVREIKEKCCFIAENYQTALGNFEASSGSDVSFLLPDGNEVIIKEQQFKCPEALFRPSLLGKDLPGIHEMIYQSVMKCDPEMRKDVLEQIILAGGSTLFKNMKTKITNELARLIPIDLKSKEKYKIAAPAERKFSVWIGGSILSSLSTFQHMWITNKEFQEEGNFRVVHKKCI